MKTIIAIILVLFSNTYNVQQVEDFILPFHQKDFIAKNMLYGKQKKLTGLSSLMQRDYQGINYQVKENTLALAIKSGKVEEIKSSKVYGEFVIINHENGIKAKYYHLNNIQVKPGTTVDQGDKIGISSTNGLTTVNSIGIEIKLNGKRINPDLIFGEMK